MKKIFVLLLGASLIMFNTGCFDIVEEVFLNKNGSGKYLVTMDMSGLFKDPFMKGMMKESLEQQEGGSANLEKDSVIYFKDMPEADELSAEEQKLIENAVIKMTMSEKQEKMLVNIEIPFANVEDMTKISKVLEKVGADTQVAGGMMGGGMMNGSAASFLLKNKTLTRLPAPKMSEEAKTDENMEMMKMFLGQATYKTIYHLPGKVKKAGIPGAEVDGSTVTVTNSLLDMMDGKVKVDGDIKFK
ncbi:MAG: hypothetical protein SFU99_08260 [Saprospiraceae bacterium]|nr:hypothetical protein [Saprospiraceae bacterium]